MASPLPAPTAAVAARLDFSFALEDACFADCVIRVHKDLEGSAKRLCSSDSESSESSSFQIQEINASMLVLSANSAFFRSLFTGSFRESAERVVEVHVKAEHQPVFSDFISFMYKGTLPEDASGNFDSLLKLLCLADQFQAEPCFGVCVTALEGLMEKLEAVQALRILSLPDSLRERPELEIMKKHARRCVLEEYKGLFTKGADDSKKNVLKKLPALVMTTLLEADELSVSEDLVVVTALAWAEAVTSSKEEKIDLFLRVVVPRLRLRSASFSTISYIVRKVKELVLQADSKSSMEATSTKKRKQANGDSADLQSQPDAWDATTSHSLYEEAKTNGICALLDTLLVFSRQMDLEYRSHPQPLLDVSIPGPRVGHRLPDHRFFLQIPLVQCQEWVRSPTTVNSSETSAFLVGTRWVKLLARTHLQALTSEKCLGLYITCHDKYNAWSQGDTPLRLKCAFCVQIEATQPAYKLLSEITIELGENEVSRSTGFGFGNAFQLMLSDLVESGYFVGGVLSIRVDMWVLSSQIK